jgi:hypothetical protein
LGQPSQLSVSELQELVEGSEPASKEVSAEVESQLLEAVTRQRLMTQQAGKDLACGVMIFKVETPIPNPVDSRTHTRDNIYCTRMSDYRRGLDW